MLVDSRAKSLVAATFPVVVYMLFAGRCVSGSRVMMLRTAVNARALTELTVALECVASTSSTVVLSIDRLGSDAIRTYDSVVFRSLVVSKNGSDALAGFSILPTIG